MIEIRRLIRKAVDIKAQKRVSWLLHHFVVYLFLFATYRQFTRLLLDNLWEQTAFHSYYFNQEEKDCL